MTNPHDAVLEAIHDKISLLSVLMDGEQKSFITCLDGIVSSLRFQDVNSIHRFNHVARISKATYSRLGADRHYLIELWDEANDIMENQNQ
jgi:hypothetical protein